jgi:hypothetical protein
VWPVVHAGQNRIPSVRLNIDLFRNRSHGINAGYGTWPPRVEKERSLNIVGSTQNIGLIENEIVINDVI